MKTEDFPLVKMNNISKNFGGVQALKGVNFTVYPREVVGLLGDNGAGKSTLLKILVGLYKPDEGEIYFEGRKVRFSSPQDARAAGIEIVYQELALVNLMSISRNFFLAREPIKKIGPFKFLNRKEMDKTSSKILRGIGISVRSTDENVSILSGGEKQSIAIGRAMYFGAKLLVLDEPTANLSVKEAEKVLEYIDAARRRGLSVIFTTHNIYHVYSVADRFTILDRGVKIGDFNREDISAENVIDIIRRGGVS